MHRWGVKQMKMRQNVLFFNVGKKIEMCTHSISIEKLHANVVFQAELRLTMILLHNITSKKLS